MIRSLVVAVVFSFAALSLPPTVARAADAKPSTAKPAAKPASASTTATKPASASAPAPAAVTTEAKTPKSAAKDSTGEPVVTHHQITVDGKVLKYTVTTGKLPIKNAQGDTEAEIFFMAYSVDRTGGPETRPLMFSFNGGPGSASVWLHLGAIGPRRVKMMPDGAMPSPPYELVDNAYTWLDQTDLVFIDPVGTGYSRPSKPELGAKFWGVQGDLESVGEFIRLYLTRYERWTSPLFLVGESYGTTRAAGLSGYLIERSGIAFNGIVLVSSILNFETADFTRGNELPYSLFLPTYTATAWYHKKLSAELEARPLRAVLDESEAFASDAYPHALSLGTQLGGMERRATLDTLARLTGLDSTYLDRADLRVDIQHFCKELLRDQRRTVGRIDSRYKGIDDRAIGDTPEYDPSIAATRPPYTATMNQYVRTELNYKTDLPYYILGGGIGPWDWGSARAGFPDVSGALRAAFSKNPDMKLFVASGHYDLATPYFATRYTLDHLGLEPEERARVTTREYEAGHMMYVDTGELAKLKADVSAFLTAALKRR